MHVNPPRAHSCVRRALDTRALCFGLAEAKLARPSTACEVLLIAVPHDVHEDIAGMGLRAGKHVRLPGRRVFRGQGGRALSDCVYKSVHTRHMLYTHTHEPTSHPR